jgi:hypothetical protein
MRTLVALALAAALAWSPLADAAEFVAPKEIVVELAPPPPVPDGFATVDGLNLVVHGHPEQMGVLTQIARKGSDDLPRLAELLGVPIGERVHVFVAETDEEFRALQPGRPPEWADATAWPDRGAVFLRSARARGANDRPIGTVLDHELIHVLLGRAFAPHEPPRWLQEGMATAMAQELGPEHAQVLQEALASGRLGTIEELQIAFPQDREGARIAYAQSADFVAWLHDRGGDEGIRRLVRSLAAGSNMDAAVYAAVGLTLADADKEWRSHLAKGLPFGLGTTSFTESLWALTAAGAAVGLIFRRRRQNARLARMAELEAARDRMAALMGGIVH